MHNMELSRSKSDEFVLKDVLVTGIDLKNMEVRTGIPYIKLETLLDVTSRVTGVSKELLVSMNRKRFIVEARYVYAKLCSMFSDRTLDEQGRLINKAHCMMIFYRSRFNDFTQKRKGKLWEQYERAKIEIYSIA